MRYLPLLIAGLFLSICLLPFGPASAACISPAGDEGELIYNSAHNVPQFCNGSSWIAVGAVNPAAGGAGCTGPDAPEGEVIYNGDYHVLQYCDGDDWKGVGGFDSCKSAPSNQLGYFVATAGTWNGDIKTAGGGGSWAASANALCMADLTANDWMGKADAQARGILTAANVRAWLCDDSSCAGSALASTTYAFAVSGDAAKGGATFTADGAGSGPGNTQNWSGVNYFGFKEYWTGRGTGTDTAWGGSSGSAFNVCGSGSRWANSTGENGRVGTSNATDKLRWAAPSVSCDQLRSLVCLVHP